MILSFKQFTGRILGTLKARKVKKKIYVVGMKDQRGPDTSIVVYVDEQDRLIVEVETPSVRCYKFSHIEHKEEVLRIISV